MVLTIKAAAHAGYYFQRNGLEARADYANGFWVANTERFGVRTGEQVTEEQLAPLLRRRTYLGEMATFDRSDRSTGRDLVFSAPKSVSICWAFAAARQKSAIEEAQIEAVKATVDILLSEACRERCGKGGKTLRPAKGVLALFNHVATRAAIHPTREGIDGADLRFPDPNLHTHVVIPDIVEGASGQLKVGYTALHKHWSMALGAWYHATLAYHLRLAGFTLAAVGGNGLFQIIAEDVDAEGRPSTRDFPSAWIKAFSARTEGAMRHAHIQRKDLATLGTVNQGYAMTRAKFAPIDPEILDELWRRFAAANGVDVSSFVRLKPQPEAYSTFNDAGDIKRAELLQGAVKEASAVDAVLQRQDLCRGMAAWIVAKALHAQPKLDWVNTIAADKTLLKPLGPSPAYGFAQWTTRTNAEDESKVIEYAKVLASESFPATTTFTDAACLNEDQLRIVQDALSSKRIVIVNGAPGTGKTALLGPVISAFKAMSEGVCIIGAAEAWAPAIALQRAFNIKAISLARLFSGRGTERAEFGTRTVLIVDEAGLLPNKRMHQILELAVTTGAKLILVGDPGQLNPIEAGCGMRLVQGIVPTRPLMQVMRQQDSAHRVVVDGLIRMRQIADGKMEGRQPGDDKVMLEAAHEVAGALLHGKRWKSFADSNGAVERVVAELYNAFEQSEERRRPILALTRSNREVQHVTRKLREKMRVGGFLTGEDVQIRAVSPMGVTISMRLAVGERIRFLVRHNSLNVYNGACATIIRIDMRPENPGCPRLAVLIDDPEGPRAVTFLLSEFHDEKKRARIAPAYVQTVYGSQGATAERIIVLKSARMTFREFYVAATRASHECEILEVNSARASSPGADRTPVGATEAIARELAAAARADRPKANANDYPPCGAAVASVNNAAIDDKNFWRWSQMLHDTLTRRRSRRLRTRRPRQPSHPRQPIHHIPRRLGSDRED